MVQKELLRRKLESDIFIPTSIPDGGRPVSITENHLLLNTTKFGQTTDLINDTNGIILLKTSVEVVY